MPRASAIDYIKGLAADVAGFAYNSGEPAWTTDTFDFYIGTGGGAGTAKLIGSHNFRLTTKGDLLSFSTVPARLAVGTNGYVLSANSGTATGLEWIAAPAAYTDEQAQDAVGTILTDSASINFTYTDATPEITAVVIFGTSSTTACVGDDARLSNARTPVGTALTSANVWVGSAGNAAAAVAVTGDVTLSNAGAVVVTKINGATLGTTTATSGNILIGDGANWNTATISGDAQLLTGGTLNVLRSLNLLLNGDGRLFERSTSALMTDGVYNGPDMWKSQTQSTGTPTISRQTTGSNSRYAIRMTAGGTSNNRFGILQIIDADKTAVIVKRGLSVIAQSFVKAHRGSGSTATDVRIAIVEWTGTADGPFTQDIVNDWTSADYTDGAAKFFVNASFTPLATSVQSVAHDGTAYVSVSGAPSSSCTNLIVFIWGEDVPVHASDYIELSENGLYEGTVLRSWYPIDSDLMEWDCKTYYQHSGASVAGAVEFYGNITNLGVYTASTKFYRPMKNSPTVVLTNQGNSGFGATPGAANVNAYGFYENRTASATGTGYFYSSWTAAAAW